MSETSAEKNGIKTIEKDNQSWTMGVNHINFGVTFIDTHYQFLASCPNATAYEYHRYVDGIDIDVTDATDLGYFQVSGVLRDKILIDDVVGD